jgi:hypothetical protein
MCIDPTSKRGELFFKSCKLMDGPLASVKSSTDFVVNDIIKKLTLSSHKKMRNLKGFDNPKKNNTITMMMMMNFLDEK